MPSVAFFFLSFQHPSFICDTFLFGRLSTIGFTLFILAEDQETDFYTENRNHQLRWDLCCCEVWNVILIRAPSFLLVHVFFSFVMWDVAQVLFSSLRTNIQSSNIPNYFLAEYFCCLLAFWWVYHSISLYIPPSCWVPISLSPEFPASAECRTD